MNNTVQPRLLNGLTLAYMGDAVYEQVVRKHLILQGQTKPNVLHGRAKQYVSAKAQAYLIEELLAINYLSDEETDFFKRGRNAKSHTKAKNTDTKTYNYSTGFESLIGYLYLTEQTDRLEEIIEWCIQKVEAQI